MSKRRPADKLLWVDVVLTVVWCFMMYAILTADNPKEITSGTHSAHSH